MPVVEMKGALQLQFSQTPFAWINTQAFTSRSLAIKETSVFLNSGFRLPAGFNANGLPIGVQLIGKPQGDTELLQIAYAYSQTIADLLKVKPLVKP